MNKLYLMIDISPETTEQLRRRVHDPVAAITDLIGGWLRTGQIEAQFAVAQIQANIARDTLEHGKIAQHEWGPTVSIREALGFGGAPVIPMPRRDE